ncbi:hypothetical protein GLA29479_3321 [Lysobacter antibioticus]|uniref:Uncharacterized protein n=1 Tax=Lysobacter antibioticus TaxID=84531 RepID=A0A0S2E110_LYSAN|nr:hypothetical protein GLA29479_3321 [Lysobacter antibioticus]ALN78327.1 hypothetical protein LA76x_0165 [Lysobacter antibioticus]
MGGALSRQRPLAPSVGRIAASLQIGVFVAVFRPMKGRA